MTRGPTGFAAGPFCPARHLRVADDAGRDVDAPVASVDVPRELDGDDLGMRQLLVEELDEAPQLPRDALRREDQAQIPLLQVGGYRVPELIRLVLALGELHELAIGGLGAVVVRPEAVAQILCGPVRRGVSGVVEHLADDQAAYLPVLRALDLHERRSRVLVDQEEVQAEMVRSPFPIGDAHLALDEQPATALVLGTSALSSSGSFSRSSCRSFSFPKGRSSISTGSPSLITKIAHTVQS